MGAILYSDLGRVSRCLGVGNMRADSIFDEALHCYLVVRLSNPSEPTAIIAICLAPVRIDGTVFCWNCV